MSRFNTYMKNLNAKGVEDSDLGSIDSIENSVDAEKNSENKEIERKNKLRK